MRQALALESVDPPPDTSRVESQEKILGHREPYNGMGVSGPGFLNAVNEKIEMKRNVVGTWNPNEPSAEE